MPYRLFGASSADYFIDSTGKPVPFATANVYDAMTGGNRVTDLQTSAGAATTVVTGDASGGFRFFAQDTYTLLWVESAGGTRFAVRPAEPLRAVDIPSLDASKFTTGTLAVERIPTLDASKTGSGVFAVARIPDLSNIYQPVGGQPQQPGIPQAVASLTMGALGQTTATINWTAPTNNGGSAVTGYYVYAYDSLQTPCTQGAAGCFNPEFVSTLLSSGTLTYNFTNLTSGRTYRFGVAAVNSVGTGVKSTINATTTVPSSGQGLPAQVMGVYWECYSGEHGGAIRLRDLPVESFNTIFVFQMVPDGGNGSTDGHVHMEFINNGRGASTNFAADMATCKNRGQRMVLVLGGAGAGFSIPNATAATNLFNDLVAFSDSLGGTSSVCAFSGIDWNCFEGGILPNATQMASVVSQLRAKYGSSFISTSPVAPWRQEDKDWAVAMKNAGALDAVFPQLYDYYDGSSDATMKGYANAHMDTWRALLGGQYVGMGLKHTGGPGLGFTSTTVLRDTFTESDTEGDNRGMFIWNAAGDETRGWYVRDTLAPIVLAA